jgi:CBS domain containing-hemolysin-like protein
MGRIPSIGDDYVHENLRFTVEDADLRRIHRVRISIEENGSGFPAAETVPTPVENGS